MSDHLTSSLLADFANPACPSSPRVTPAVRHEMLNFDEAILHPGEPTVDVYAGLWLYPGKRGIHHLGPAASRLQIRGEGLIRWELEKFVLPDGSLVETRLNGRGGKKAKERAAGRAWRTPASAGNSTSGKNSLI